MANTQNEKPGCGAYVVLWIAALVIAGVLSMIPFIGPVLGVLLLTFAVVVHVSMARTPPAAKAPGGVTPRPTSSRPVVTSARSPKSAPIEHRSPAPTGTPVEPWSRSTTGIEVVGEAYRDESFAALFRGTNISGYDGAELRTTAALVDDSSNPHDRNAVAIWVQGRHVGFLDRETASQWSQVVRELNAEGRHLTVDARVWASTARGRMAARVTLYAPLPEDLFPVNALPEVPHLVLPGGSSIQVTQEDRHMDVLTPYATGGDVPVAVTLHAIHEIRPRSAYEAVEARIGDRRIGVLSRGQSENLLPLVKFVEDRGLVPVARGTLRGNALKADVTMFVVKAQDADPSWLASLGPATTPVVRPTRPDFEWDD